MKKFLHLDRWRLQLHRSNPYWNIWCSELRNLEAAIATQGHLEAPSASQGHLEAPSAKQSHKIQHILKSMTNGISNDQLQSMYKK